MDRYRIPVKFMMKGYVDTPCKDLKSAVAYALHPDTPLPKDREYVAESLEVDIGRLYADARASFPNSDGRNSVWRFCYAHIPPYSCSDSVVPLQFIRSFLQNFHSF